MCTILLSTASSIVRVQTPQKHPHNALLFNRWSGSNCALFPGAFPQRIPPGILPRRLHIFRCAVPGEFIVKAQMPVASWATGICRILCCLLRCEDFAHQVCSLGGGLTDLHACCFQSFLLRLSGLLAVVRTMDAPAEA